MYDRVRGWTDSSLATQERSGYKRRGSQQEKEGYPTQVTVRLRRTRGVDGGW